MSERLHPDADSLGAFVEGVLPEHERLACLAHLAECSRCREVVYLAQEAAPVLIAEEPVRWWKRWFTPIPVLSAAAVACAFVVSIAVYRQYNRPVVPAPAPQITASVREPAPDTPKQPPAPAPRAKANVEREPIAAAEPPSPPAVLAEVAGTITDPAGAVVPQAQINLKDDATGSVFKSTSDARGQFSLAGLAPGRYELNIDSPGFKRAVRRIDLQPQEVAKADSILEIGASTDTVTVSAEASLLKTESGEVSHTAANAPANALPVLSLNRRGIGAEDATTAAKGKLMLKTDAAGGLFLSKNSGKVWKAVKGPWQGKVVRLDVIPDPAKASNTLFQLTTDSASVWLSPDGNRWYQAPAQR
jgi:hypothetical protein